MSHKSVEHVAENIRKMVSSWHAAQCAEEQWRVENQIGEEVFRSIFAEDTGILGPWHLKTKGKHKEEKYEKFKARWEALCSSENLGIGSKDLLTWCRCVGLGRLLADNGFDPGSLSWLGLCEIQRLKSRNHMVERARKVAEERLKRDPSAQRRVGSEAAPPGDPDPQVQPSDIERHRSAREAADTAEVDVSPYLKAQSPEHGVESYATIEGLTRLIEHPKTLLANADYEQLMSDPVLFKEISAETREQLRRRVEAVAEEMECFARKYRDFEAVLRWSRRF